MGNHTRTSSGPESPVPGPSAICQVIPASSSVGSTGWPAGARTTEAERSASQAGQLSRPGATRGLVARTISKPAP
jgi:hypothetical protein